MYKANNYSLKYVFFKFIDFIYAWFFGVSSNEKGSVFYTPVPDTQQKALIQNMLHYKINSLFEMFTK